MKVGDLKKLLSSVPDETLVVVGANDHSYREATAGLDKAVREKRRLSEYHGPEHAEPGATVIDVLVIN